MRSVVGIYVNVGDLQLLQIKFEVPQEEDSWRNFPDVMSTTSGKPQVRCLFRLSGAQQIPPSHLKHFPPKLHTS